MSKDGYTLWVMTMGPVGVSPVVVNYTPFVERLRMVSVSPGGFGILQVRLHLSSAKARLPRPELAILNGHVVVMEGRTCCYSGEIREAAITLDAQGEGIDLVAQGGAGALSDDPQDSAYTATTAQAILAAEISKRSVYLAIDADTAGILPGAPAVTFSPAFDGKTIEDILHELSDLLGDYSWGVWDHPVHRDSYGFPTWQLVMHPRDITTVKYRATMADVLSWRIAPSVTRAFNGVTLHYLDPIAGPGSVSVYDSRLGVGNAQGTAPFRFRRFRRDLGNRVLNSAQATALANAYLASFENVTNVIEVKLTGARDGNGHMIPLHTIRADTNITIPELLTRAAGLPALPVVQAGVNTFYIRQAQYDEVVGKPATLTLLLDQVADFAAADLTRLRYEEQLRQRSKKNNALVQPAGIPLRGVGGGQFYASAASQAFSTMVGFPVILTNAPTSVTLTAISSSNANAPVVGAITQYGFLLSWSSAAAGQSFWYGYYLTVGN